MKDRVDQEVAIEIINTILGMTIDKIEKEIFEKLLKQREQIYLGDQEIAREVVEKYGVIIKKHSNKEKKDGE